MDGHGQCLLEDLPAARPVRPGDRVVFSCPDDQVMARVNMRHSADMAEVTQLQAQLSRLQMQGQLVAVRHSSVRAGEVVVASWREDRNLYRAVVDRRRGDGCDLTFIDFGNRDFTPWSEIYSVPSSLRSYKVCHLLINVLIMSNILSVAKGVVPLCGAVRRAAGQDGVC